MFKSHSLERKLFCAAFALLLLCGSIHAQSSGTSALEAYTSAMKQSRIADRISAMEHFRTVAEAGNLKIDGLEILAWDYRQTGNQANSRSRAQQLLAADPNNPLALAILSEQDDRGVSASRYVTDNQFAMATRGLVSLARFGRPEGMLATNFTIMQQQVAGILHGIAGLGYLDHKAYDDARDHLKQALAVNPNDVRYTYGMALALLLNKRPDAMDGYLFLARAVNLAQGTPSGQEISAYARNMYKQEGGTDANWDQFLQVTAAPGHSVSGAVQASNTPAQSSPSQTGAPVQTASTSAAAASSKAAPSPKPATTIAAVTTRPGIRDEHPELKPPAEPAKPEPIHKRSALLSPNAPVSLGILVQTALLSGGNRHAIVEALTDMVHKLRTEDEAFIMAFSNQLDFEQDLTANDELLADAMMQLKPKSGAALIDGIEFAIGHLKRIGKNPSRVLLVISDGRNETKKPGSTLSAQLHDVRIDCIGIDVGGSSERDLLEKLASYSGGHASFASSPDQVRNVTSQVAQIIGIEP